MPVSRAAGSTGRSSRETPASPHRRENRSQFGRWGEVFGDDVVAAAMIDRLVHHAEVIAVKGDSYRLKDRDLGRVPNRRMTINQPAVGQLSTVEKGRNSAVVDIKAGVWSKCKLPATCPGSGPEPGQPPTFVGPMVRPLIRRKQAIRSSPSAIPNRERSRQAGPQVQPIQPRPMVFTDGTERARIGKRH